MISNFKFPKVFVLDPSNDELITDGATEPKDLAEGAVAIVDARTMEATDATPVWTDVPVIQIHQNLGDTKHGTVRTKNISAQKVVRWRGVKATAAVDQILYIGYDEVVGTKNLVAYKGQDIVININVFDNELSKFWGVNGFSDRIVFDASNCAPCVADCEQLDPDAIADFYVDYINSADTPSGLITTTREITNWVTASKVATGTEGEADRRVGIKLVVKSHSPLSLESCNTQQFNKVQLTTISAGVAANCPNFPITTTVKAKAGQGFPAEVAELERESQGYDRVRDVFEDIKYQKNNFIIRATAGVKYDLYYLEFNVDHNDSGQPKTITDPYLVVFAVPTGTGGDLEAFFNAWLAGLGFEDVDISSSTDKGTEIQIANA